METKLLKIKLLITVVLRVATKFAVINCEEIFKKFTLFFFRRHRFRLEAAVAQLIEALRYKPEGRGFDSRWCHWNFSLT
jgi:hypothetical protein